MGLLERGECTLGLKAAKVSTTCRAWARNDISRFLARAVCIAKPTISPTIPRIWRQRANEWSRGTLVKGGAQCRQAPGMPCSEMLATHIGAAARGHCCAGASRSPRRVRRAPGLRQMREGRAGTA